MPGNRGIIGALSRQNVYSKREKGRDEESRNDPNGQANRGRCEPGASRIFLKITSEPQAERSGVFLGTDGIPPLQGNTCDGMSNRWYNRSMASVLLQDGGFF